MELLRHALARLRGDLRRSLAIGFAVLVAVASFVVLTGTAQTQRLEVTQTVAENFRGAYDILVRPAGSTKPLEAETGQVRSAFLSGVYGGITMEQVAQIQALGGIEVAAPVAMLGTTYHQVPYEIDITDLLPDVERFVVRYTSRVQARNGHIDLDDNRGFVYFTTAPFTTEHFKVERSNSTYSGDRLVEMVDGVKRNPCFTTAGTEYDETEPWTYWSAYCVSLAGGNDALGDLLVKDGRVVLPVWVAVPLQVAAIDPEAEATLLKVDGALTAGRYLTSADTWTHGVQGDPKSDDPGEWLGRPPYAPAVLAGSLEADYQLSFSFDLLPDRVAEDVERMHAATLTVRTYISERRSIAQRERVRALDAKGGGARPAACRSSVSAPRTFFDHHAVSEGLAHAAGRASTRNPRGDGTTGAAGAGGHMAPICPQRAGSGCPAVTRCQRKRGPHSTRGRHWCGSPSTFMSMTFGNSPVLSWPRPARTRPPTPTLPAGSAGEETPASRIPHCGPCVERLGGRPPQGRGNIAPPVG